jgi:hypothetical protein
MVAKKESFDALAASRRWRARSSRELAGLTYKQLRERLSRFATAEALVRPTGRHASHRALAHREGHPL